jgi:hypothetical protein
LTTTFDITEPKSPEDIKELIEQRIPSIDKDALESIIEHKIDSVTFLELTARGVFKRIVSFTW